MSRDPYEFVRHGAVGIIADINEEWGRLLADDLASDGGKVHFVKVDVTNSASVAHLLDYAVRHCGGVDVLVNCAGVGVHKAITELTDEEWDFQINTQLRAVFLTCRAAARQMIHQNRGGRIINFGSTAATVARVRAGAHCASKAGVLQLTKVLALELGPYAITANVVAPGLTNINAISRVQLTQEYIQRFVQEVPLGRLVDPQEVADVVLFIASERARFVSGQVIHVDGGYTAGKLSVQGPEISPYAPPTVTGHKA